MLQKGDVVFFKSTTWISRIITKLTRSQYSHVALAISENLIIEADRFVNTRIRYITLDDKVHEVYRLEGVTLNKQCEVANRAIDMLGYKYDYLQIMELFFKLLFGVRGRLPNRLNYVICSELIDVAYYTANIPREFTRDIGDVTPQDLLHVYKLRKVSK